MVETELFAQTYKSYRLATVRHPVLEVEAKVEPFENGRGFSLRVLRTGNPRRSLNERSRDLQPARLLATGVLGCYLTLTGIMLRRVA
jgi:hypothetical protein